MELYCLSVAERNAIVFQTIKTKNKRKGYYTVKIFGTNEIWQISRYKFREARLCFKDGSFLFKMPEPYLETVRRNRIGLETTRDEIIPGEVFAHSNGGERFIAINKNHPKYACSSFSPSCVYRCMNRKGNLLHSNVDDEVYLTEDKVIAKLARF